MCDIPCRPTRCYTHDKIRLRRDISKVELHHYKIGEKIMSQPAQTKKPCRFLESVALVVIGILLFVLLIAVSIFIIRLIPIDYLDEVLNWGLMLYVAACFMGMTTDEFGGYRAERLARCAPILNTEG